MAEKPKSINELITYLTNNPRVRLLHYCKNKLLADEQRTFLRCEDKNGFQRLFFDDKHGEVFTPLFCPNAMDIIIKLRFVEDRFSVLVMALDGEELAQFHYYYQD